MKKVKYMSKMRRHFNKTFENKLIATILFVIAVFTVILSRGDFTTFVFLNLIAVPLFFAKNNWIC